MSSIAYFWALLLIVPTILKFHEGASNYGITDDSPTYRFTRGALSLTGGLLQKAKRLISTPYINVYWKSGGAKQALKDFKSLKPTLKADKPTYKWGRVDTKKVELKLENSHSQVIITSRLPIDSYKKWTVEDIIIYD